MDGTERRKKIMELLETDGKPWSGTALAAEFGVSRQVIVQDIALLRATDKNILSTNKGYILFGAKKKESCKRVIRTKHTDEQMREEMYTVVDAGARFLDVIVEHEVYGQIAADLIIGSRKDVDDFIKRIFSVKGKPLKELTGDEHYHTIEAANEEILDEAERGLCEKGYLYKLGE